MDFTQSFPFLREPAFFVALALCFAGTAVVFLIVIMISRIIKTRHTENVDALREDFQKTINALIILDQSKDRNSHFSLNFYLKGLREKLSNDLRKQVLIDVLIANKKNLRGTPAKILKKIYVRLQLKKISYSKLNQTNTLTIVQGLQELTEMECADYLPTVQELFYHKDTLVRQESFIGLVRLTGDSPFVLVDHYQGFVTPWMQLMVHKHLTTLPLDKLPKFYRWFYSDSNEIKKFAVVMATQFRQAEAIPHLSVLLDDINEEISGLAVAMLGEMGAVEHANLIEKMGRENLLNDSFSLRAIHALEQIGNPEEHGSFLAWHMVHGSPLTRFEAMRAMHKLKMNCRDFLIDFNAANDELFENIYRHVTTPLLQ